MSYIVLDFEFNQSFEPHKTQSDLSAMRFEIIQIGACKLNDCFDIIETFSAFIKPHIHIELHPYVERLTGIHSNVLQDSKDFPAVYQEFLSFTSSAPVLCTWGADDLKILYRNVTYYGIQPTLQPSGHINLQSIVSRYLRTENKQQIGLKNAVKHFDIAENLDFHNALSDAVYTAKILKQFSEQPDFNLNILF